MDSGRRPLTVSVIIVSYEVRALLARCLTSLRGCPEVTQTIVVDNGSSDGSSDEVREHFPGVELIPWPDNRGFAVAVNAGAARATAEYLLLLNPDAEVPAGTTARMCARLDALGAGALGVRQVDSEGGYQLAVGPGPSIVAELGRKLVQWRLDRGDLWVGAALDRALSAPRVVPWAAGSCLLVRRDAFAAVGGFDEDFFLFFEDIDFCLRLGEAGYPVWFEPSITVLHRRGQSTCQDAAAASRAYRRSQLRYWRKHRGGWAAAVVGAYVRARGGLS